MSARAACLLFAVLAGAPPAGADVVVVTLLGTGTPRPQMDRLGAAILVEAGGDKLLFDAGRGVARRLLQVGADFGDVRRVFVTHLHYDHVVGLPDLFLTGWIYGRAHPLEVSGPAGVAAHVRHLRLAYDEDIRLRLRHSGLPERGSEFAAREIAPGVAYLEGDLKVTAFAVDHGVVEHAFGYRVDYRGRSFVVSGDTSYSQNLVAHARGVDLLVHEVATASAALRRANPRLRRVLDYHATPDEVARVLRETKPRLAVLVHPLVHGVSEEQVLAAVGAGHSVEVVFGRDRMAIDVGERLRVYRRPGRAGF